MASYDRQILVPYLRDVCSAEMLCAELERDIASCENRISKEQGIINRNIVDPKKPKKANFEPKSAEDDWILPVAGVISIGIGLWLMKWISFLAFVPMAFGVFFIWLHSSGDADNQKKADNEYKRALAEYERKVAHNQSALAALPGHQQNLRRYDQQLRGLKNQLVDTQRLRDSVYSVNIIPSRYRNIHAAYYLYDYFNTCRESDLDKVIQTMLLDEIKQRLGAVIAQNQEIILNQRYQIAMQEEHNRAEAERHRESMRRMARMEQNQEKQMDYQQMIAKNQEVTNFFLAADYFRKERRG